ncbi:thioesterase family protein [Delftia tsuruhatensis]|uniref:thioesterase family protein n=1 Tax=Delftia tsuruhatensis TaxID=180282 RepID=UPI001F47A165|nr:thioesterase family protein [Delftia tsuruhatensis]
MLESLAVGAVERLSYLVPKEKTVPFLLPESPEFLRFPEVLATGYMVGLMEWCCIRSLAPFLQPGEGSLGTMINVKHLAATPPGCLVNIESTVISIFGRQVVWRVVAHDSVDIIGEGEIGRTIVKWDYFNSKLEQKKRLVQPMNNSATVNNFESRE